MKPYSQDLRERAIAALEAGTVSHRSGILLNRLAIDVSHWKPSGTGIDTDTNCEMADAVSTEPMSCEIDGIAIVAASGKAYQAHFASGHTSSISYSSSTMEPLPPPPAALPVDGAFGGLERFLLTFPIKRESKTWSWAAD